MTIENKDIMEARVLLGVNKEASISDIRKAWRKMARELHPDRNHAANATEEMQKLNNAIDVLVETDNGRHQPINIDACQEANDARRHDVEELKFFFGRREPSSTDIPEKKFQQILKDITNNIRKHPGRIWIYSGSETSLSGATAFQISRLIAHCVELGGKDFDFDEHNFRPEALASIFYELGDYMENRSDIFGLNLGKSNMNHPEVIKALCYFLDSVKGQWRLKLEDCNLTLEEECLVNSLICNKSVTEMELTGNPLSSNNLARVFAHNCTLTKIGIGTCYSEEGLSTIMKSLSVNRALLDLSCDVFNMRAHAQVKIDTIQKGLISQPVAVYTLIKTVIEQCIKNQGLLESLTIKSGVNMDSVPSLSANEYADIAGQNTRLRELQIMGINLSEKKVLTEILRHFPGLETLYLYDCRCSDEALITLADYLKKNTVLKSLAINGNENLHWGQAALFSAMRYNQTLQKLHLTQAHSNNPLEKYERSIPIPETGLALRELFEYNTSLSSLDISACNAFSPKDQQALANTLLKYNSTLTSFEFRYSPFPHFPDIHHDISNKVNENRGNANENKRLGMTGWIYNRLSEKKHTNNMTGIRIGQLHSILFMAKLDVKTAPPLSARTKLTQYIGEQNLKNKDSFEKAQILAKLIDENEWDDHRKIIDEILQDSKSDVTLKNICSALKQDAINESKKWHESKEEQEKLSRMRLLVKKADQVPKDIPLIASDQSRIDIWRRTLKNHDKRIESEAMENNNFIRLNNA